MSKPEVRDDRLRAAEQRAVDENLAFTRIFNRIHSSKVAADEEAVLLARLQAMPLWPDMAAIVTEMLAAKEWERTAVKGCFAPENFDTAQWLASFAVPANLTEKRRIEEANCKLKAACALMEKDGYRDKLVRDLSSPPFSDYPGTEITDHIAAVRLTRIVECFADVVKPPDSDSKSEQDVASNARLDSAVDARLSVRGWYSEATADRQERLRAVKGHLDALVTLLEAMEFDEYPLPGLRRCLDERWLMDIESSPERMQKYSTKISTRPGSTVAQELMRRSVPLPSLCFDGSLALLPAMRFDAGLSYIEMSAPGAEPDLSLESTSRVLKLYRDRLKSLETRPKEIQWGKGASAPQELFVRRFDGNHVGGHRQVTNAELALIVRRLFWQKRGFTAQDIGRIRERIVNHTFDWSPRSRW